MTLKCRYCNWETEAKHFGFIMDPIKKDGNNLCIICYWGHTDRIRNKAIHDRKELDNAK